MIGGGTSDGGWDDFDWDAEAEHGPNWDNFDWKPLSGSRGTGKQMKLEDLVILHFEGTSSKGVVSNKVWGRFQKDNVWHRFWGKSTAAKFQVSTDTKMTVLETQDKKVKKGYGPIKADTQLFKDTAHVLQSQFGITPELLRSLVTGVAVEEPIKPSEVVATKMEGDVVIFWDEHNNIIGTRPLAHWDKIQEHLLKTKLIKANDGQGTNYWEVRK